MQCFISSLVYFYDHMLDNQVHLVLSINGGFGLQKGAEAHLPVLTVKEGILISMEDMETFQVWNFKYRFELIYFYCLMRI